MISYKFRLIWIIALLFAFATNTNAMHPDKLRFIMAQHDVRSIEMSLELFKKDMGRYPTTEEGIKALVSPTPELLKTGKYPQQGYLHKPRPDPWGSEYQYFFPAKQSTQAYDLFSLGADGKPGGLELDADIGNWPGSIEAHKEAAWAAAKPAAIYSAVIIGTILGFILGLPVYISGLILKRRKGFNAYQSAKGFHLGVLIYIWLICTTLAIFYFL